MSALCMPFTIGKCVDCTRFNIKFSYTHCHLVFTLYFFSYLILNVVCFGINT